LRHKIVDKLPIKAKNASRLKKLKTHINLGQFKSHLNHILSSNILKKETNEYAPVSESKTKILDPPINPSIASIDDKMNVKTNDVKPVPVELGPKIEELTRH